MTADLAKRYQARINAVLDLLTQLNRELGDTMRGDRQSWPSGTARDLCCRLTDLDQIRGQLQKIEKRRKKRASQAESPPKSQKKPAK